MEDRRRYRRWQAYLCQHLCQPVWDRFFDAAALRGLEGFPAQSELLDDRRKHSSVEWQTPAWEWVDPQNEQQASQNSIDAFQSTYQEELGARGRNWRSVFYQRQKEEKLKKQLGLVSPDVALAQAEADKAAQAQAAGDMTNMSRLQWKNNRKAIDDILSDLVAGKITPARAQVDLQAQQVPPDMAQSLIADAADGVIDEPLPAEEAEVASV